MTDVRFPANGTPGPIFPSRCALGEGSALLSLQSCTQHVLERVLPTSLQLVTDVANLGALKASRTLTPPPGSCVPAQLDSLVVPGRRLVVPDRRRRSLNAPGARIQRRDALVPRLGWLLFQQQTPHQQRILEVWCWMAVRQYFPCKSEDFCNGFRRRAALWLPLAVIR